MSQTSISFTEAMSIPEDEPTAMQTASSESLLEELELELTEKVSQMRELAERLALRLENNFRSEMLKLPKAVKTMSMREFLTQYGGDVDEAVKQQAERSLAVDAIMMPPPAPVAPGGGAPPSRSMRGGKTGARTAAAAPAVAPASARGKRNAAALEGAANETPGVRGRATRSRLTTAATPAAGAKGLTTPAASSGAVAFTPRMHETPRVMQRGDIALSQNGSPLNLLDTVKARGKRDAAPSVCLTLADGSEMDLGQTDTLKGIASDDETKAQAVAQLEQLQAQVEAHLRALKAPYVPEI